MSDQPANINLRLALDRAALNQSAAGVDKMQKELFDLRISLQNAGGVADKSIGAIGGSLDNVASKAASATRQVNDLNSAMQTTSQTAASVSSNFSNIGTFRRAVGAAGNLGVPQEIVRPLQIAGDLGQIGKALEKFGLSLDKLPGLLGSVAAQGEAAAGGFGAILAVVGPAALAIGAVAVAVGAFKSNLDAMSEGITDALTGLDAYYKAIEKGTTDSLNSQIKQLTLEQQLKQAKVDQLQKAYDIAHPAAKTTDNETADAGAVITGLLSDLSSGGKDLNKDLEESKKALKDTGINLGAFQDALKSTNVATNDAAEAEKILQTARDKSADKNIQIAQQTAQLEASGTTKGVQDRIAQIEAERKAISDSIATGELSAQKTDELRQRTRDLAAEEERLTVVIGPVIKAREDETEALKKLNTEVQQAQKLRDEQAQKEVDIAKKYNGSVQSAEDTAATTRLNANQKLQDAFVAAAEKAVDDANKALDQLNQKRDNNLLSQTRDQDKITRDAADKQINDQIKAQRQERDDLQSHLDNLKQIRDRDAGRQRDDLLNRNYRDLFALNEQKSQDMGTENDRYSRTEQQRQQALQNEEQDQLRAIQAQRRERLISYQQANQDAVKQYNIELQNAEQAKSKAIQAAWNANVKELALIRQNLIDKEALLRQGAINELKLTSQTSQARQKIFQDELNQARAMLGQTSIAGSAPFNSPSSIASATPYAAGGRISAFQAAVVNEPGSSGREGFNGVPFPPGQGLFMPFKAGNINPNVSNSKSVTVNLTVNTNSTDRSLIDLIHGEARKAVLEAVA